MDFDALFERWQEAEDELDLQLVKDTVRYMEEIDDDLLANRAGDLLSGVYHLTTDPSELAKIDEIFGA